MGLTPTSQAMEEWTLRDDIMYYEWGEEFVTRIDTLLADVPSELLMRLEERVQGITWLSEMDNMDVMKLLYLSNQTRNTLREQASKNNITENEKEEIEAEILLMQKGFLAEMEKNINLFMTEVASSIGSREMGDMSWSFSYNIPFFGNLEMSFDMKEYIADTESLEDMRLRGAFEIMFTIGEEIIESRFELDFIVTGNDIYILIDNLDVVGNEDILANSREIIEVIQVLWKTKTYIYIGNTYGEMAYDFENILLLSDVTSQEWYTTINTIPLMTTSGKINNTYFLSPKAEMCHITKTLMNVFDPFSWETCSSGQFEEFRENMSNILDVRYTQRSSGGRFEFLLAEDMFSPWSWLSIQSNNNGVQSLDWDISDIWKQTHFLWNYRIDRDINFEFTTNNSWSITEVRGNIWLSDTGIESMNVVWNYSDDYTNIEGNVNLTNGILKGALTWKDFNDDTFECTLNGIVETEKIEMIMNCSLEDYSEVTIFTGKLGLDTQDMKNNFNIEFSLSQNEVEIMHFHLQNTAVRKKNVSITIPTPKKYIPLEKLIESIPMFENMFLLWISWDSWEDNYEIQYNEGNGYSETCYIYNSGESECYKNYDDGVSETCYDYTVTTGEKYCSYSNDEYYYDGELDVYYYYEGYQIDGKTGERTEY